jgi:hypothetical protein
MVRLREWRAVATRYKKTARSFLGVLCIAATEDRLKSTSSSRLWDSPLEVSVAETGDDEVCAV